MQQFSVIWSVQARNKLNKIYKELKNKVSLETAQHVRKGIQNQVGLLEYHPRRFPKDRLYKNKSKEIRVFNKWSYRISYQVTKSQVRVVLLCYAKQKPSDIQKLLSKI